MTSGAFVCASFLRLSAIDLLSKSFVGPMIFDSLEDAIRQLLTGINVLPSLHPSVNRRNPLRNFVPTWSKTLEPSSVFLQLVRLKRVSSTMNTLTRFSSVRFLMSSLMIPDAREEVKRSQLVFEEFRKR